MIADRKYAFSWQLLGDPSLGRPHLGLHTRIEELLYAAGKLAGMELYRHRVPPTESFNAFIVQLQSLLSENKVDCWCTGDRTCRFTARRLSCDEDAA
jgi:hypothetical protein